MTQLQELRKSRGITQAKVALDTGIALGTYTTMETGCASISPENAEILSIYYGVEIKPTKRTKGQRAYDREEYLETRIEKLVAENKKLKEDNEALKVKTVNVEFAVDGVTVPQEQFDELNTQYENVYNRYKLLEGKHEQLQNKFNALDDDFKARNDEYYKVVTERDNLLKQIDSKNDCSNDVSNATPLSIMHYLNAMHKELGLVLDGLVGNFDIANFMSVLSTKMSLASELAKEVK